MTKHILTPVTKITAVNKKVSIVDFVHHHLQKVIVHEKGVYFYVKDPFHLNCYVNPEEVLLIFIEKNLTSAEITYLEHWEDNIDKVVEFLNNYSHFLEYYLVRTESPEEAEKRLEREEKLEHIQTLEVDIKKAQKALEEAKKELMKAADKF